MTGIIVFIASVLLTSVFSVGAGAGTLTPQKFLYKPSLGARGETEKALFDAGLDRVDARLGKEVWVGDPNFGPTLPDALTAIGGNNVILRVPAGTHSIAADLTFPANITLKPERGALLDLGTVAGSGNATNSDTAGTGTISCTHGTTIVTGAGTNFRYDPSTGINGNEYLTLTSGSLSGTRRQIKRLKNDTTLEVMSVFHASTDVAEGTTFSLSSKTVTISNHNLEMGDSLTFGATGSEIYYVAKIISSSQIEMDRPPSVSFSGGTSWARGVRVKLGGPPLAGNYQWISGGGVVRIMGAAAVNPEWWGAVLNSTGSAAANLKALNRAAWCMGDGAAYNGGTVLLSAGIYYTNGPVILRGGVTLQGSGRAGYSIKCSTIQATGYNGHLIQDYYDSSTYSHIILRDLYLYAGTGDCIHTGTSAQLLDVSECYFNGGNGSWACTGRFVWFVNNHTLCDNGILSCYGDSKITGNEIYLQARVSGAYAYGLILIGDGNIVSNNTIFADASRPATTIGLYLANMTSTGNQIANNRLNTSNYGLVYAGGHLLNFNNNVLYDHRSAAIAGFVPEDYWRGVHVWTGPNKDVQFDGLFVNNTIKPYTNVYAFQFTADNTYLAGGQITDNILRTSAGCAFNIDTSKFVYDAATLIERNVGFDLNFIGMYGPALEANTAQPSVLTGKYWRTANTSPTTVAFLKHAAKGKEVAIQVADDNTTFDFTGTNLDGNAGADFAAKTGDAVRAVFDGVKWYCEVHQNVAH